MGNIAPTQEVLREHFEYNEDGRLVWKKNVNKRLIGKTAGSINCRGYMRVTFMQKTQQLHRLVWIFWNGEILDGLQIDHIDRNKANNKIENLRLATGSTNCFNRSARYGEPRYFTLHSTGKFQAQVRSKYLGLFNTEDEARKAVQEYLA